jgi:hypothetical protein
MLLLPALLMSAVVTDYAAVTVPQTTLQQTYTDVRADVLTTGALSEMIQQVLRSNSTGYCGFTALPLSRESSLLRCRTVGVCSQRMSRAALAVC